MVQINKHRSKNAARTLAAKRWRQGEGHRTFKHIWFLPTHKTYRKNQKS
jgi:hypothetical protein